ncbi:NADH kinase pos5 [Orbilia oligospora]|uniref:NADH kinase pos5 n=1 Tax=Orbilia oligospora TaxID=2813651 RepID=A0A7C8VWR8_ORBOL|nr:NADH kinase pos5 [Orbilia oligospora]
MATPSASDPSGPRPTQDLEKLVGGPVAAALYHRRKEFLQRTRCTVKVTTWNVASIDGAHRAAGSILREPAVGADEPGGRGARNRVSRSIGSGGVTSDKKEKPLGITDSRSSEGGVQGPQRLPTGSSTAAEGNEVYGRRDGQDEAEEGKDSALGQVEERETRTVVESNRAKAGVARTSGSISSIGQELVSGGTQAYNCIHVICLQEVVDVTAPENFIRTVDEAVQKRWKEEIQAALPEYRCLLVQQLVGVLMFVYVSPEIAPQITTPSSTSVGTGLMGYMGNKGGAMARLVFGGLPAAGISPPSFADSSIEELRESEEERGVTVVFVDCHLAAFVNSVDRRNWDYTEIMRRAYFHPNPLPISGGGTVPEAVAAAHPNGYPFKECDIVVWAGDLNYRLEMPGNKIRKAIHKFLPSEADGSDPVLKLILDQQAPDNNDDSKSNDLEPNRSFEETISFLLESDQLRKVQSEGKAFQHFHEGKIMFVPTYKYDPGTISTFDTSEKARVPSYCDRILWKDWKVEEEEIERLKARKLSDERDQKRESHLDGTDHSDVLFDFADEEDVGDESELRINENDLNIPPKIDHEITSINDIDISDIATPLKLLKYFSHQSVAESDHKPVSAEFSLDFLGVNQEKRSQIQIEVVKELDRHENEARPAVTVIVDGDPSDEIVNFGDVTWDQVVRRTVTIANTGRTAAVCEFVKRPVLPAIMDDDDDGFTKVTSEDANDPMAFGEESSATGGATEEVCREWLSATFNSSETDGPHMLQPGDAEQVTLQLALPPRKHGRQPRSAYASLLRHLNKGKEQLADVLVMRVSQGQDKFIPVKAEFKPTFLGYGLTELLRVPDSAGGIRENPKCTGEAHWSAPRELFRMTEYLLLTLRSIVMSEGGEGVRWTMLPGWPFVKETWGMRTFSFMLVVWTELNFPLGLMDSDGDDDEGVKELTRSSVYARSALKRWIRESLDCDKDWAWEEVDRNGFSEEDKCEAMSECLLDWLGYLKEGVLPGSLYGEVVKGVGGKAGADKILDMLPTAAPPVHTNVFIYLTGFISEVISLLSPKYDAAITNNFTPQALTPAALVKRLSASSRLTTTELVKKSVVKEFAEVIVRRPTAMDGWRSDTLEKREEERSVDVRLVLLAKLEFVTHFPSTTSASRQKPLSQLAANISSFANYPSYIMRSWIRSLRTVDARRVTQRCFSSSRPRLELRSIWDLDNKIDPVYRV